MRGLGDIVVLAALVVLAGVFVAGWLGFLAAVGITVARWFL